MPLGSSQWMYSSGGFYSHEIGQSLRFEDTLDHNLTRTPASAGNRKTWTFSVWVKRAGLGKDQSILHAPTAGGYPNTGLFFNSSDQIRFTSATSGSNVFLNKVTTARYRDISAWYHIVAVADFTNTSAKLYVNGSEVTTFSTNVGPTNTNSEINNTVSHTIGHNSGVWDYDGYMAEIHLVDGTALDADDFGEFKAGIWTPKKYTGSYGTNGFYLPFQSAVNAEGQSTVLYTGTAAYRSVQGFGYKPDFVWIKNREATQEHNAYDRVRGANRLLYPSTTGAEANSAQHLTSFDNDGISLGTSTSSNGNTNDIVAWAWDAGPDQAKTGFGCVRYVGTGARRFVRDVGFTPDLVILKKENAAANHAWYDSVRGPAKRIYSNATSVEATGGIESFDNDGFDVIGTYATDNDSGSQYIAWCWDAGDGDPVSNTDGDITSTVKASDAYGFSIVKYNGTQVNGNTVGHGLSSAPEITFHKNLDTARNWESYFVNPDDSSYDYIYLNLTNGKGDMAVSAPSSSVITLTGSQDSNRSGDEHVAYCFHSVSGYSKFGGYTGTGSTGNAITGLGFRPAWVMIKRVDAGSEWAVYDSQRTLFDNMPNQLRMNANDARNTNSVVRVDLDSDGFTIETTDAAQNANGGKYIYLAFAGGLDTIAPMNTDGSIDSRVKASDDTGFSIVKYRGSGVSDTVGHGLSNAPDWILTKDITDPADWAVYHSSLGTGKYLELNTTDATTTNSVIYNAVTASTFSVGVQGDGSVSNTSGDQYISYCWTATTGKSAFGTYTGTGSAGNAQTIGFEPALVILKRTDSTSDWAILDNFRDPDAAKDSRLRANTSAVESTVDGLRFTSTGFSFADDSYNNSSSTWVYAAFADGRDASYFFDQSGNNNHFENEHLHNYDVVPDSPTNNFVTLNSIQRSNMTYSRGNLRVVGIAQNYDVAIATHEITIDDGNGWYWEWRTTNHDTATNIGIAKNTNESFHQSDPASRPSQRTSSTAWAYIGSGSKEHNNSAVSYGDAWTTNDILQVAVKDGKIWFGINGVWQGSGDPEAGTNAAYTGITGDVIPFFTMNGTRHGTANFGQDSSFHGSIAPQGYTDENEQGDFAYPVPAGFKALCTANFPDPAIDPAAGESPEDYFNAVLYTGNGAEGHGITGVGFRPDMVWYKQRSAARDHGITDVVRGTRKTVRTSTSLAEVDVPTVTSFDSDGFTVGSNALANVNAETYVAWNWKAGGTAVSNTDGSITSSVSANTKAGFSVVTYTGNATSGATVGHGLDSAPEVILLKDRDGTDHWRVYHSSIGNTKTLYLNLSNAAATDSTIWNNTSPTSSVFTIGNDSGVNTSANDYIAYCFHGVKGYSKFGFIDGNSNADGNYVYCGFRPAWIMTKQIDGSGGAWFILDVKRNTYNVMNNILDANTNGAERTADIWDVTSNGMKLRISLGGDFVFLAFAEQPFKYSNAR